MSGHHECKPGASHSAKGHRSSLYKKKGVPFKAIAMRQDVQRRLFVPSFHKQKERSPLQT